jgi:hypothetical protein
MYCLALIAGYWAELSRLACTALLGCPRSCLQSEDNTWISQPAHHTAPHYKKGAAPALRRGSVQHGKD